MSRIASLFYHALDQAGNYLQSFTHNHVCLWHPRSGRRLLIKAMNGLRNIAGGVFEGIKAAGLKITSKRKHEQNVQTQKEVNKVIGGEGSWDCLNRADLDSLFLRPLDIAFKSISSRIVFPAVLFSPFYLRWLSLTSRGEQEGRLSQLRWWRVNYTEKWKKSEPLFSVTPGQSWRSVSSN